MGERGINIVKVLALFFLCAFLFSCPSPSGEVDLVKYWPNGADGGLAPRETYVQGTSMFSGGLLSQRDKSVVIQGANSLFRKDYRFTGWNTQPDGSGAYYQYLDRVNIMEDTLHLYAQWESFLPDIPASSIIPREGMLFDEAYIESHFPNASNTGCTLPESSLLHVAGFEVRRDGVYRWRDGVIYQLDENDPLMDPQYFRWEGNRIEIRSLHITGTLYLMNSLSAEVEVFIENCYITNRSDGGRAYGIACQQPGMAYIRDCTVALPLEYHENDVTGRTWHKRFDGADGKGILAGNCVIERCDVSGYMDGVYCLSNVICKDSYIHDLYNYNPRMDNPYSTADTTHSDGTQGGWSNYYFYHNRIETLQRNAAGMYSNQQGNAVNICFDNNLLRGGNYVLYFRSKGPDSSLLMDDVRLINNVLYNETNTQEDPTVFQPNMNRLISVDPEVGIQYENNFFLADNSLIPIWEDEE